MIELNLLSSPIFAITKSLASINHHLTNFNFLLIFITIEVRNCRTKVTKIHALIAFSVIILTSKFYLLLLIRIIVWIYSYLASFQFLLNFHFQEVIWEVSQEVLMLSDQGYQVYSTYS